MRPDARRGRVVVGGLVALAVGGTAWAVGLRLPTVGLLVLAVAAVTALVVRADPPPDPVLRRHEPEPVPGVRTDVADLVWVLTTRSGHVGLGFHRRLVAAARVRLRSAGVDPDDDAAVADALGAGAAAVLGREDPPTTVAATTVLDALERLGTGRPGQAPARRTARPGPAGGPP